jgi:subtilisin family serine protease
MKREDLSFNTIPAVAVIGIVDGGVDTRHPVVQPILWRLPVELAKKDWPVGSVGYDFSRDAPDPMEELENSHGTHVTGLATGRQLAIWLPLFDSAGLANNVGAFSLKVAGADGSFDFTAVQNAIQAGVENNVSIFNLSLFGPWSKMLRQYLTEDARLNSTLLVIAAGNEGVNLDASQGIHRSFRNDDGSQLRSVIFVAALSDTGGIAEFSNYGKTVVQIAAPGVEISSTIHPQTFGTLSGTSQAAPLVSLTAAILRAEKPTILPLAIKNRILNTCDFEPSLEAKVANGCKLNLLKAVVRGSDLIELKANNAIVRGDVDCLQFGCGTADDPLIRVWMADPSKSVFIYSSGKRQQKSLAGKSVAIKPHSGETCPQAPRAGNCTIQTSDVLDVVFRLK